MDKEEMVHAHNGKKDETMAFAALLMSLEIIIPCEISQKEKDKYPMTSFVGVI